MIGEAVQNLLLTKYSPPFYHFSYVRCCCCGFGVTFFRCVLARWVLALKVWTGRTREWSSSGNNDRFTMLRQRETGCRVGDKPYLTRPRKQFWTLSRLESEELGSSILPIQVRETSLCCYLTPSRGGKRRIYIFLRKWTQRSQTESELGATVPLFVPITATTTKTVFSHLLSSKH